MQKKTSLRRASTNTDRKSRVSVVTTNSSPSSPHHGGRHSHASDTMPGSVSTTHAHAPGRDDRNVPRQRRSVSTFSSAAAEPRLSSMSPRSPSSPVMRKTRATVVATTVVPESVLEGSSSSSSVAVVDSESGSVTRRRSGYRGRRVNSESASNVTPPLPLLPGPTSASVNGAGGGGTGGGGGGGGGMMGGTSNGGSSIATPTRSSLHISPAPSQTLSSNLVSLHDIHGELAQNYLTPISASLSAVPQPVAFSALHFNGRSASWRNSAAAAVAIAAAAAGGGGGHTSGGVSPPLSRPRGSSGSGSRMSSDRRRSRQNGTPGSAILDDDTSKAATGTPTGRVADNATTNGGALRRQSFGQGTGRTRHSLGRTRPSFSTAEAIRDGEPSATTQSTPVAPSVSSTQFTLVNTQSVPPTPAAQPALPALTMPLPMPALDTPALTRRPPTPPPLERDSNAGAASGSGIPRRGSWMLSCSWAPPGSPTSVAARSPSVASFSRPSSRTSLAGRVVGFQFDDAEEGDTADQLDYSFAGSTSLSMASEGRSFVDELPPPPPAPPAQLTLGRSAAAQQQSVLSTSPYPSRVLVPSSRQMPQQQQRRDSPGALRLPVPPPVLAPPMPPPPPPPPVSIFNDDYSRAIVDGGDSSGMGASVTSLRRGSLASTSSWVPGSRIEPLMLSAPAQLPPTPPRSSIPSSISNKSSLSHGTPSSGTTNSRMSSLDSLRSPVPLSIAAAAAHRTSTAFTGSEGDSYDSHSTVQETAPAVSFDVAQPAEVPLPMAGGHGDIAEGLLPPLKSQADATSSTTERSTGGGSGGGSSEAPSVASSAPTPAPTPRAPSPAAVEDKKNAGTPPPPPPPPPPTEAPARPLDASASESGTARRGSPVAQEPSLLSNSEVAATARLSKSLALSSRQQELAQSFRERIQVGGRTSRRRQTAQPSDAPSSSSPASQPPTSRRGTGGGSSGGGTSSSDGVPSRTPRANSGGGRRRGGSLRRNKVVASTQVPASPGAVATGVLTLAAAVVMAIAYARLLRPVHRLRARRLMAEVTEPAAAYRIQCWWRRRIQLRRVREKTALQLLVPWVRFGLHRLRGAEEASARLLQRVFRGEAVRSLHRWLYGQRRLNAALGVIRRYVQRWEAQNLLHGLQLQRDERKIVVEKCVQGCRQLFRAEQLEWTALVQDGAATLQFRPSVSMQDWVTGVAALTGVVHQLGNPDGLRTVGPAAMAAAAAQAARTSTTRLRDRLGDMAQLWQLPTHATEAHASTALLSVVDGASKRHPGMRSPPDKRSSSGSSGALWDDDFVSLSAAPPPRSPMRSAAVDKHVGAGGSGRGATAGASRAEEEEDAGVMDLFKRAVPAPVATTDEDVVLAFLELLRHTEATERVELERRLLAEHQAILRRPLLLSKAVVYANEMLVPPLFAPLLLQMQSDTALEQAARLFEAERVARGAIVDMYVSMPLLYLRRPMLNPAAEARHCDTVRLLKKVDDPWGDAERNERRFYRESAAYRHLTSRDNSVSKLESSAAFFTPHPSSLPTPPPDGADSVSISRSTNALQVSGVASSGARARGPDTGSTGGDGNGLVTSTPQLLHGGGGGGGSGAGELMGSNGPRVRVNVTPRVYYPAPVGLPNASGVPEHPAYASFGSTPMPSANWSGGGGEMGSGAGGVQPVDDDDPHAASFLTNCHNGVGDAHSKTAIPSPHRRPRGPPLPLLRKLMPSSGRNRQGTSRPSLQPTSMNTSSRPSPPPRQLPSVSVNSGTVNSAEPSGMRAQFLGTVEDSTLTRGATTRKTLPGVMVTTSNSGFLASAATPAKVPSSSSVSRPSMRPGSGDSSEASNATTVGYGTLPYLHQQQPVVSAMVANTAVVNRDRRVFSSPRIVARVSSLASEQPTEGLMYRASFMKSGDPASAVAAAASVARKGVPTSTTVPELAVRHSTVAPPPPLAPLSMELSPTPPLYRTLQVLLPQQLQQQQQQQDRERHAPLSGLPLSPGAVECHASKNAAGVASLLSMPAVMAFNAAGAATFPEAHTRGGGVANGGGPASTLPPVNLRAAAGAGSTQQPSLEPSHSCLNDSSPFTRGELHGGEAAAGVGGGRVLAQTTGPDVGGASPSRTQRRSSNFGEDAEEALRRRSPRQNREQPQRPARASRDISDFPPSPTVSNSSDDADAVAVPELGGGVRGGAPRSMLPRRPPTPPPRPCHVSPPLTSVRLALHDVLQCAQGEGAADHVASARTGTLHAADEVAVEAHPQRTPARRKSSSTSASRGGRGAGRFLSPVTKSIVAPSIPAAGTLD